MREIDRAIAEEAVLKKAQEIHKERVDALKAQAVREGTPMRSTLFGIKVGGVDLVDGKPSAPFSKFNVHDREAALDWLDELNDMEAYAYGFARDNIEKFAEWYLEMTGECADGCTLINGVTEEVPMSAKFVIRSKAKVAEVIDKLRESPELTESTMLGLLGADIAPLLEGGLDDLRDNAR